MIIKQKKLKPKPQLAKITKVVKETKDTSTLRLQPTDWFEWDPGQFIMVHAQINGLSIRRAYSISSSPTRSYLEITIRQTDTPTMSKYLNLRTVGEELEIKGPYGRFIWKEGTSEKIFCLGAGSGITPFRAFLEYFIDQNLQTPIALLYSCSYGDNVIFEEELRTLTEKINRSKYKLSITRDAMNLSYVRKGRINVEYLRKEIVGYEDANFYICGAPGFVSNMIQNLLDLEIERTKIKREQWG